MREVTYRDLVKGLRALGLNGQGAVIAHVSLSAFGRVAGGAEAVVGALLASCETLVMPTFTYETMVVPEAGPPDNAVDHRLGRAQNDEAVIFHLDLPASRGMGVVAEAFRRLPAARRSGHPILSFAGVTAEPALESQTLENPLAPLEWLEALGGAVLLVGVDHTANTSIHLAEQRAGRKRFVRWALTSGDEAPARAVGLTNRWASIPTRVVACPNFPGCSDGFGAIASRLIGVARETTIGPAAVTCVPLAELLRIAEDWLREDPLALLCTRPDCERCTATRKDVLLAQSR